MSRRLAVTVAMLVALMTLCALSVSAYGEKGRGGGDDEGNESASGGATRNGQIVFHRYFDPDQTKGALFTMNPTEATSARTLTLPKAGATMGPAWSPDGERIAFHRQRTDESTSRIMLLNPETGNTRQVTHSVPQGKQCSKPVPRGP